MQVYALDGAFQEPSFFLKSWDENPPRLRRFGHIILETLKCQETPDNILTCQRQAPLLVQESASSNMLMK